MKLIAMLLLAAAPAAAFDLPAMNAAAVKAAPGVEAPAVKAANQSLWMTVTNNPAVKEAQASDWSKGIEARVRASGADRYDVDLRSDQGFGWGTISKYGNSYNFFGSGMNFYMSGGGSSHFISGSYTENGKTYFVSVNVSGADAFSGSAYGNGVNLFLSRGSINGWFDEAVVPRKALAAVASFILALQLEAGK